MDPNQLLIKMVFDRWNAELKNFDTLLKSLSDEQVLKEIAPGKNRGIYLLGHLVAVNDDMLRLLDFGNRIHTDLDLPFIKSADKVISQIPTVKELRNYWDSQLEVLKQKFDAMSTEQWFEKHTAVSAEDFDKEPHRNKLNIIISRTSHLAYHAGQMALLK